ncbi:DUF3048 domain-containing protein [Saccharothrix mutabilis subsp. mutabilis]|uniref:DUF3048 domain-containing protein n=1 Tax=Saccharothrix mutabilis subsp. mutabilis TaxID=66855 RepID=A0ABP3E5Q5_9PSEU
MRAKWQVGAAVGASVLVVAGIVAAVVITRDRGGPGAVGTSSTSSTSPSTTTTSTTTSAPRLPGVLAVKVDNAPAARPQTGAGSADVVFVEPVEGGLTRLVLVFSTPPDVVGPVRSARETDLDLLAQYGSPVLAHSGSAPELVALLAESGVVRASPAEAGDAFFRDPGRPVPHNLYVRPDRLPAPAAGPTRAPTTGPAPPGGRPVTTWSVRYPATGFDLAWAGAWAVSVDGSPMTSTESGPVSAANVVVQRVPVGTGAVAEDTAGSPSPVAITIGSGAAVVLRDGSAFDVTWSRPTPSEPTRFAAADGSEVPLAPGRTWVFLVPE